MSPASGGLCSALNHETTSLIPLTTSKYLWWLPLSRAARISNNAKMALLRALGMVPAFYVKLGKNVKELAKMVDTCKDEFWKFDLDYQQLEVASSTVDILASHYIPSATSDDLK